MGLENITLYDTTYSPATNKEGVTITAEEMDLNFITFMKQIQALMATSSIAAYNAGTYYESGKGASSLVRYNGTVWKYIALIPQAGVTPGTDESVWMESSPSELIQALYIPVTRDELLTRIDAETLQIGTWYKITDRADIGLFVYAVTTSKVSTHGFGVFLNADYQLTGDYSDVTEENGFPETYSPDGSPANTLLGIYPATPNAAGDICIRNGIHYLSKTGVLGSNPEDDTTNWHEIPKNATGAAYGYYTEIDYVEYDLTNDWITCRSDKRGNRVSLTKTTADQVFGGEEAHTTFQFGNDGWYGNIVHESVIDALNWTGSMVRNRLTNTSSISDLSNVTDTEGGFIKDCVLDASYIYTIIFGGADSVIEKMSMYSGSDFSSKQIASTTIGPVMLFQTLWTDDLTDDADAMSDPVTDKYAAPWGSNIVKSMDVTNTKYFQSEALKYPVGADGDCNVYGELILTGDDVLVSKVMHSPSRPFRIFSAAGITTVIQPSAVATATADQIIATAGSSITITGDAFEWVELEKRDTRNYLRNSQQYT